MEKDKLKDLLFEILNRNSALSEVSLDNETDTIFVKAVGGEKFIVTVSPVTADETIIGLWEKKNPELMSPILGIMYMRDLGVFTEEEADGYLAEIIKCADNSIIGNLLGKDR